MDDQRIPRLSCLAVLLAAAFPLSVTAAPFPHSPSQRLELFQTCAGRLSAEIEHGWLMSRDTALAETRRAEFDLLAEAVLPDALDWGMPREMSMHWRITAKAAQASLLSEAVFALDPSRAERARLLATQRLGECDGLVIG